jgi:hypothetical protein
MNSRLRLRSQPWAVPKPPKAGMDELRPHLDIAERHGREQRNAGDLATLAIPGGK